MEYRRDLMRGEGESALSAGYCPIIIYIINNIQLVIGSMTNEKDEEVSQSEPENPYEYEYVNESSSQSESGYFKNLINYYRELGYSGSHLGQALFLLAICSLVGLIFILFFALQTPYQMTLYSGTNSTQVQTITFWNSVYTVISVFGVGVLVAGASFFLGGLLGFLFGIPKTVKLQTQIETKPSSSNTEKYVENTNLEDVSDWLTKIIIGVGLVELTQIPQFLNQYAEMIAPALGGIPSSGAFGIAILVYYSIVGFLFVYLSTRGYMESELERSKRLEWESAKYDKLMDNRLKQEKMFIERRYAEEKLEKLQNELKIKDLEEQIKNKEKS
jgi:hypothetical protein